LPVPPRGRTQTRATKPERTTMSMLSKIPSKYLKGHHIEAGEIVTIKDVCDEKVGVSKEEMSVIYFDEYDRGVILELDVVSLVKDLGDDEDIWPGRKIVLTTVPTRNPSTGEDVDAIRMQAALAKKKAEAKWLPLSLTIYP
jgi:hypothetical protein